MELCAAPAVKNDNARRTWDTYAQTIKKYGGHYAADARAKFIVVLFLSTKAPPRVIASQVARNVETTTADLRYFCIELPKREETVEIKSNHFSVLE